MFSMLFYNVLCKLIRSVRIRLRVIRVAASASAIARHTHTVEPVGKRKNKTTRFSTSIFFLKLFYNSVKHLAVGGQLISFQSDQSLYKFLIIRIIKNLLY